MNLTKIKKYFEKLFDGSIFFDDEKIILFLCGNEALPNPLDSETELEFIEKAEKGDEYAKNKLIEHNLRLVVYICKKFTNTNVDMEDLISVGSIGLIKAVNSFKLEKNIKLATYASRCIENEILMYLRKTSKLKAEISLDEPLTVDGDGNELVLSDILSVESDSVTANLEKSTEKKLLWNSIQKLNSKEREIMILPSRVRQRERRGGASDRPDRVRDERQGHIRLRQGRRRRQHVRVLHKARPRLHRAACGRPQFAQLGRKDEGFAGPCAQAGRRLHHEIRGQRPVQVAQQGPQRPREVRLDARAPPGLARHRPASRRREVARGREADDAADDAERGAHAQGPVGGGAGVHDPLEGRGHDTVHQAVLQARAHEAPRLPAA